MAFENAGEVLAGELAALVGIKNLCGAMSLEGFLQRFDAKAGIERVGYSL